MKKRLLCILLCALLCLSPVLAAEPELMDLFTFREQYAADYAREHPEEYAAFDAAAAYMDGLYRAVPVPMEDWMAHRNLDEAGFKAVMFAMHIAGAADAVYPSYRMEAAFPAVKAYPDFADVAAGSWYESAVRTCCEVGLMRGTDLGFEPEKSLTVAECATIAARIREALTGEAIVFSTPLPGEEKAWYQDYLNYMCKADPDLTPVLEHPEEAISRMQYLLLLDTAINHWMIDGDDGADYLMAINYIGFLPDTDSDAVLRFYMAGVLAGTDKYGTFAGDRTLTRAECAAMAARLVRPDLRLCFELKSFSRSADAAEVSPVTLMFEKGVTAETFLNCVNTRIFQLEEAAMTEGVEFSWDNILSGTDQTYLQWIEAQVLEDLGVTEEQGTQAYKRFGYSWYYQRFFALTGKRLKPDYGVAPGGMS